MVRMLGVLALCSLLLTAAHPSVPMVRADDIHVQSNPAIEQTPARPAQTKWLDRVAEFFRLPIVNVALVALGMLGLIFEIKYPGTTFPGGLAAICFVLFFWAFSFVGEFTLLAILLFLLGLVFLGIEVFIVPGLAFSGVAGAGLMFVGLLLVTLDHWPSDHEDWTNLGARFGSLAIGLALAVVGALVLTWSLPNVPLLNRMVLKPPGPDDEAGASSLSLSSSGQVDLLGAIGVAVTPLRPAGKAQFGEQFLDVIAEGDYVSPGGRVRVVEIEGTRIVVKEM